MKGKLNHKMEKILLGFAAGVMIAASIWSLILPSIELAEISGKISWLPVTIGFASGIAILLVIDKIVRFLEKKAHYCQKRGRYRDILMMIAAITIHNIPEGIAVGVAFAGALSQDSSVTVIQAMILALGVAIQNFPEGAIVSLPLRNEGISKKESFFCGILSGIVEPIAAIITIILATNIIPLLPYFLSFAAGAMVYVVINELIPETNKENGLFGTIGFTFGFLLMMILDIALG